MRACGRAAVRACGGAAHVALVGEQHVLGLEVAVHLHAGGSVVGSGWGEQTWGRQRTRNLELVGAEQCTMACKGAATGARTGLGGWGGRGGGRRDRILVMHVLDGLEDGGHMELDLQKGAAGAEGRGGCAACGRGCRGGAGCQRRWRGGVAPRPQSRPCCPSRAASSAHHLTRAAVTGNRSAGQTRRGNAAGKLTPGACVGVAGRKAVRGGGGGRASGRASGRAGRGGGRAARY